MHIRTFRLFGYVFLFFSVCLLANAGASRASSAPKGEYKGTFYRHFELDPVTLNPITASDVYSDFVHRLVLDTLMKRDMNTFEWVPCLAEKVDVSKDGLVFTFKLRKGVKWHDGRPLLAEDVKYSFDVFFEGRFNAPGQAVFYEKIKEARVIDPLTVQFIAKEPYYKNLDSLADLFIIPKHFYGKGDPNDPKFNREVIGTGPYMLAEWEKGQRLVLKRNPGYWGDKTDYYRDHYRFARIFFRPVKENTISLELLKKGDLDFLDLSQTPDVFVQNTRGPEWGKKVIAVKVNNDRPRNFGYGFLGWNNRHPFFKDRDVRVAMSHLINRDLMIEKFRYNMSEKASGPFGNSNPLSSPKVKPISYDPKKAVELLKKSGWKMGPSGMHKIIDGKNTPFEFTLLSANPSFEKYLTMIKEDMKRVGITMNIRILDWSSFIKLVDERKFEAIHMGLYLQALDPDPKQNWHSAEAPSPGHNFVGYSNPVVDKLIDRLRVTQNASERKTLFRRVHELIAADQPISFLFNTKYVLYVNTARIKKQKDTFRFDIGERTWWVNE